METTRALNSKPYHSESAAYLAKLCHSSDLHFFLTSNQQAKNVDENMQREVVCLQDHLLLNTRDLLQCPGSERRVLKYIKFKQNRLISLTNAHLHATT